MSAGRIRVVVADDHPIVRIALRRTLNHARDMRVIGEAADGVRATKIIREERPDVALIDYLMPEMDGADAAAEVRDVVGTRVLMICGSANDTDRRRMLAAGVAGILDKSQSAEAIVEAVREVAAGGYVFPNGLPIALDEVLMPLSRRERELVGLIRDGKRLNEAAAAMSVTASACSTFRLRALKKLGLNSTAELIRYAMERNL